MHKQVSRLSFILLGRLPATKLLQWLVVSVRPLHGYWGSSEFSSAFPWQTLVCQRFFKRRCTRYSFAFSINGTLERVNVNPCAFGGYRCSRAPIFYAVFANNFSFFADCDTMLPG